MSRDADDKEKTAFVREVLTRKGWTDERIENLGPSSSIEPKAVRDLRFQPYQFRIRRFRGRTVNAGALDGRRRAGEFPEDKSWLQSQAESSSALHFVATDKAKGKDSAGVQRGSSEEGLRAIVRQMPKSLLCNAGGRPSPDWVKIFDGAALRRTRSTPMRAYVAERRWRENATRDELQQEALANNRDKGPHATQAYVREVGAAWRYLDLPSTQQQVTAFIRAEKHSEDLAVAGAVWSLPAGPKGAIDRLREMADLRKMADVRLGSKALEYFCGPSIAAGLPKLAKPEARPPMAPPLPRDVGTGRPRGYRPPYRLPRGRARFMCKHCGRRYIQLPAKCKHCRKKVFRQLDE